MQKKKPKAKNVFIKETAWFALTTLVLMHYQVSLFFIHVLIFVLQSPHPF